MTFFKQHGYEKVEHMETICKESPEISTSEETKTLAQDDDIIVCAQCGHHITEPVKQMMVDDAFRHVFANPHGHVFEIGCFSHARGCRSGSIPSLEFSWFRGFAWEIGVCQYCTTHLGWIFSSGSQTFYGLILDRLIFP